jgi:hypothetical protein
MVVIGVALYFLFSWKESNYLNPAAVFSGVWMVTIGLSQIRLNSYQVIWEEKTWRILFLGHLSFIAGYIISKFLTNSLIISNTKVVGIIKRNILFNTKKLQKYFILIVSIFGSFGIIAFIINVLIKGYIPAFVSQTNQGAYFQFYTRFHIFYVASLVTCGFSYFMIRKWEMRKLIKVFLASEIFILLIIIPLLLVQRGTFLTGAFIYISTAYYSGKRSFKNLLLQASIVILVFLLGTMLRGYTNEQLTILFPQEKIENNQLEQSEEEQILNSQSVYDISKSTATLHPKLLFIYAYLTVSHENFNNVVKNLTTHTRGIWQIRPFNVLIRSETLEEKIMMAQGIANSHMVKPYLNTFNLITMAYFDFGTLGVIVFMIFWSFVFGLIESIVFESNDPFSNVLLGISLTPIALCFMNPWMSDFTIWLLWGSVFLILSIQIFYYFRLYKKWSIK